MNNDMFLVRIGGAELGTTATSHEAKFQRITGWYGLPSARGESDAIPGSNGSYVPENVYRSERQVTVTGYVHQRDHESAIRVLDSMSQAFASDSVLEMGVQDSDGWWYREVIVTAFETDDPRGTGFARFTIDLISPDPVRYREPVVVGPVKLPVRSGGLVLPQAFPWDFGSYDGDVATVVNDGTVPVLPRTVVTGSGSSLTVHGAGRRVQFGAFSGEFVFDSSERRAWLNGTDVTRQLVRRDWPVVEPGESADFYFRAAGASPDVSLLVEYRIGVW